MASIFESEIQEGPFDFNYRLRTIFFSKEVISLLGEFNAYTHLPHGHGSYEGKTFCRINGQFQEITLDDLFKTAAQKEFLWSYCEKELKKQPASYFFDQKLLANLLQQNTGSTFVVDDHSLIIVFQPYIAGSYVDGPLYIKIPYAQLHGHWNDESCLPPLLNLAITSQSFVASWDESTD